jgi:hypothetical protein
MRASIAARVGAGEEKEEAAAAVDVTTKEIAANSAVAPGGEVGATVAVAVGQQVRDERICGWRVKAVRAIRAYEK